MAFNGWVVANALRLYQPQARLKGGRKMARTALKILLMAAGSRVLLDPPPDALPSG